MQDIDSVADNLPVKSIFPKNAELKAVNGKFELFKVKDFPLGWQVWSQDTYIAGFRDEGIAMSYLRNRC